MSTVTTVADLTAANHGQTITCHGWQGEFGGVTKAEPGYVAVWIDDYPRWVKLDQPCRIEARP